MHAGPFNVPRTCAESKAPQATGEQHFCNYYIGLGRRVDEGTAIIVGMACGTLQTSLVLARRKLVSACR